MFKVAVIIVVFVMVVGLVVGFGCGGNHTVFDGTALLASGETWAKDLKAGHYDVDLTSDDGVTVTWIGGGVDQGYNSNGAVTQYSKRDVPVFQSTTFKLYNPTGIFFNPTATVHLRIVKR